ncbi:unnamed protein product [Effrenium voratum]|nr:unnamed protein product [Effrenium voratum]
MVGGPLKLTHGKTWADVFEESEELQPLRSCEERLRLIPARDCSYVHGVRPEIQEFSAQRSTAIQRPAVGVIWPAARWLQVEASGAAWPNGGHRFA